jgi:methylmalonyl-CoA/ethylmalonyl-CoA epimerase
MLFDQHAPFRTHEAGATETTGRSKVTIALNQLGQVSLTVDDIDKAEEFYGKTLGLRKLYRFGSLVFFDCAGVRLFIDATTASSGTPFKPSSSVLYYRTTDIRLAFNEMKSRGVSFVDEPHLVAPMEDHDLWMVFFKDPAGNLLAMMHEAPKGYVAWTNAG